MMTLDVQGSGTTYYVERDGVTAAGPFTTRWRAEDVRDDMVRKAKAKVRPCITCQTDFHSEGPHNRMCDSCRSGETVGPAEAA